MVSPVDSETALSVTRTALKALGLQFDQASVRSSVIALPDNAGHAVTVVQFKGSLTVRLLRVDADGDVFPLFEGGVA